jgi:prefoldin beta subunit
MSDISQLPPNVQERIARLQQLQNTMQQLLAQKQRLEAEQAENERALKTLEETPESAKVYKSVGAVLVERDKTVVVKELTERKDFLDMRKKVLEKQEEKTKEKVQGLQETLQRELGIQPQPNSS